MNGKTPTKADIMSYSPTVPVSVAAAYLGTSPQSIRISMRKKEISIGEVINNRCKIYPLKLIAAKEGTATREELSIQMKTVAALLENGAVSYEGILALAAKN